MLKIICNNIYGMVILTRPVNVLITFISVFVGAWVGGKIYPFEKLLFACLSAGIICGGGNVLNDYFDVESDRVNKPGKSIPAGYVSRSKAFVYGVIFSLVGFSISFLVSFNGVLIAGLAVILLFLYNRFLKKTVLLGNLIVCSLTSQAFIYGGAAVENIGGAVIPAVFAFFFHFGREIIKDAEDIEGDKKVGIVTFPIKFGIRNSVYFTAGVFILLFILTLYPFIFMDYSIVYLLIVLFGVDLILFYLIYSLFKNSERYNLRRINNILKGDMLIGLLALYLK